MPASGFEPDFCQAVHNDDEACPEREMSGLRERGSEDRLHHSI